jgi:excisionase family DNA binding protein
MLSNDLLEGAKGASQYSGLKERTIYNLTETGKLPFVKVGGKLYFRKSALDRVFTPEGAEA